MSRYIDAEKFKMLLDDKGYVINKYGDINTSVTTINCCLESAKVDAVEVKHGYWKGFTHSRFYGIADDGEPIYRLGKTYRCSNSKCNKGTVVKYPYCPWCGTKMDERKEK